MAISFGILYSEIKTELKTSHAETAWIFSLFNGLLGLTGLPLGFLLHKINERWLTAIGTLFLIAGMISSSFASKISTLYVTYGVISGVGAGIVHYCANTIIVRHFSSKWCPLAITIANSGSAVSSLVFPPVLTASIQSYGWKTTFLLLSGTSAVGLFSAASYVAPDKDIDTKMSKESHHDGGFFGLYTAVVAHYLDRSHIPVGLGLTIAANGISSTTGMPLAGFVSDLYDGDDGAFVFGACVMFFAALILSVNVIKEFFFKDDVSIEYEIEITRF
ncbi:monocarboxylate transporter 4-like [Ruditapes philippinarum]|uniref:monocarboxylate transporter 4-like n=1 Tax=Ruditapes philippinarum TaxID=129788 RepID=UPI00295AC166|nr:monocarboxylate transporter 4-like [Ruditapes philippinarum]